VPSAVLGSAGELQGLIALRTTAELSVMIGVAIIIPVDRNIVIVISIMVGLMILGAFPVTGISVMIIVAIVIPVGLSIVIVVAIPITIGVSIMLAAVGAGDLLGIHHEISTASPSDPNTALIKSPSLVLSACRLTMLPLHAHSATGVGGTIVSAAIFGSAGDHVLRKSRCGTRDKKGRQNELRKIGAT
jgi:hypothetical protein